MTQLAVVSTEGSSDGLVDTLIAGRYRILEVIGRGGMGVVYSARDEEGGPEVVIKFLGSEWTGDADAAARFEREAKRLGALQHANIVRMLDFGHEDGRAYLVMEFVQGEPLAKRMRNAGQLTLTEFVPIAAQILKGVGHAHSRGVVLRDIKASNVMLCQRKGRANFVVLLDFGLAKRLQGDTPITREYVMGTAGYIAPEALSSSPSGLGVDVYALGVLFWKMLTGAPPFEADDDAAMFYKTVHEPVPSLSDVLGKNTDVPIKLASLIERCLAKSPDDRPSDANAIVEALIDTVPARMFRLPRTAGSAQLSTGEGNTGMIALTGINPSGTYDNASFHPAPPKRRAAWVAPVLLSVAAAGVTLFLGNLPSLFAEDAVVRTVASESAATEHGLNPTPVQPSEAAAAPKTTTVDPAVAPDPTPGPDPTPDPIANPEPAIAEAPLSSPPGSALAAASIEKAATEESHGERRRRHRRGTRQRSQDDRRIEPVPTPVASEPSEPPSANPEPEPPEPTASPTASAPPEPKSDADALMSAEEGPQKQPTLMKAE